MILQELEKKERVERRNQGGTNKAKRKVNDINREKIECERVGNDCKKRKARERVGAIVSAGLV